MIFFFGGNISALTHDMCFKYFEHCTVQKKLHYPIKVEYSSEKSVVEKPSDVLNELELKLTTSKESLKWFMKELMDNMNCRWFQ